MIDYLNDENKEEKIMINCGTKFSMNLKNFFNNMNNIKFGEIIFNSIENDGTGNGLDLSLIKKIPKSWKKKPILLMGGAGKPDHIAEGLKLKNVSGIITANLFNFRNRFTKVRKTILNNINLADFSTSIKFKINIKALIYLPFFYLIKSLIYNAFRVS